MGYDAISSAGRRAALIVIACTCCRDKDNPKEWYVAKNITVIPPTKQLGGSPLENMKAFFSGAGN